MEWLDKVFHAKYDEKTNNVALLTPIEGEKFFFEKELEEIEQALAEALSAAVGRAGSVISNFPSAHSMESDYLGVN